MTEFSNFQVIFYSKDIKLHLSHDPGVVGNNQGVSRRDANGQSVVLVGVQDDLCARVDSQFG